MYDKHLNHSVTLGKQWNPFPVEASFGTSHGSLRRYPQTT